MCKIWLVSAELPPSTAVVRLIRSPRKAPALLARAAIIVAAVGAFWCIGWSMGGLPSSGRYYAAEDLRRSIKLPDQSKVELNRSTGLLYLDYRSQRQVIFSDGEAYFDVQKNADKPFLIHADKANIRVTGTHFNVWTAEEQTMVTVTQGAVQVSRPDGPDSYKQTAELTAGMQVVFSSDRLLQLNRVDPSRAAAWRDGKLILDGVSLRDALPLINRYLSRPLQSSDVSVGDLRIGGIYDTSELEHLVGALPQILPVSLQHFDDVILVSSRSR